MLVAFAARLAYGVSILASTLAAAVTMTATLVLYFLSGPFAIEDPATTGTGFAWTDIAVLAAWGIGALIIAPRSNPSAVHDSRPAVRVP